MNGSPIGEPIRGQGGAIGALRYSPDDKQLGVGEETSVWVVDTETWQERQSLANGFAAYSLAWTDDGARLAAGLGNGKIIVWDSGSWSEATRLTIDSVDVTAVAWTPDGKRLVAGSANGAARLWSSTDWHRDGQDLRGHANFVVDARFSDDGRWLATFGGDGAAVLWDVELHRQLGASLVGSPNEFGGVWMAPDAGRLLTYQADGSIWDWPLDDNNWMNRVCSVAGRDLTEDEWTTYAPGLQVSSICPDPSQ